jgi:hypothetical protein
MKIIFRQELDVSKNNELISIMSLVLKLILNMSEEKLVSH